MNVLESVAFSTRRPRGRYPGLDDLVQVGAVRLLENIHLWEPERGTLATFAIMWSRQAMGRCARVNMAIVSTGSRSVRDCRERASLEGTTARDHRVRNTAYRALAARVAIGFDDPISNGDDSSTVGEMLADDAPGADELLMDAELQHRAVEALNQLPERTRRIVWEHASDSTLDDIGARLGITRERCRQLEAGALPGLRAAVEGNAA